MARRLISFLSWGKFAKSDDERLSPLQAYVSTLQSGAKEVHGSALLIYKNPNDSRQALESGPHGPSSLLQWDTTAKFN